MYKNQRKRMKMDENIYERMKTNRRKRIKRSKTYKDGRKQIKMSENRRKRKKITNDIQKTDEKLKNG